jgi:hypothetical protein
MLQRSWPTAIVLGTLVASVLVCADAPAPAADPPIKSRTLDPDPIRKYKPLLPALEAWLGEPVAGKRWGRVRIDYRREYTIKDLLNGRPEEVVGWLVADGPEAMTLLTDDGDRVTLPTRRGLTLNQALDPNTPVAGALADQDFRKVCRELIDEGLPDLSRPLAPGIKLMDGGRCRLEYHVMRAAQLGAWSLQAGDATLAIELFDRAADAHASYEKRFTSRGDERPLDRFLAEVIADTLRVRAISAAHHDRAGPAELQGRWERIESIPGHSYVGEAKELARGYADLAREDKSWIDAGEAAAAKLDPAARAAYWMHRLRDQATEQEMFPGKCDVLSSPLAIRWENCAAVIEDRTSPALELKKLGTAAIPALIAQMDDPRPTRCEGRWRWHSSNGIYLLRYGDACQQIFEAITGHRLPAGGAYPMKAGKGKECKAAAEKWYANQLNKQ